MMYFPDFFYRVTLINLQVFVQIFYNKLKYRVAKKFCCPVSGFLTEKCQNNIFGEFCQYMRHKSKYRLLFKSFLSFGVKVCNCLTFLYPFLAKYAKIDSNYLKMSGFSSRNVRYPRYQDTDLLQLCIYIAMYRFWAFFSAILICRNKPQGSPRPLYKSKKNSSKVPFVFVSWDAWHNAKD